jgi:hypothetical protein
MSKRVRIARAEEERGQSSARKIGRWNLWPFSSSSEDIPHCKTLADTIKNSNVGKFQTALKPILKDLGINEQIELPKIVFCGQESSGKSSTVERAANLPFTPRNRDICTRQPLYLECKHLEDDGPADSIYLQTPNGPQYINMENVREGKLEDEVKKIMFNGPGINEIPIKMIYSSRKVPTMSFCDLPGTISVAKIDEPNDIKERTIDLLKETIEDPHALIVAVVTQDVRNNIALETLQKMEGVLNRTVVVLAKADTLYDNTYKSRGKGDAYWKLRHMLTSNPIKGYAGIIIPVVNRDTSRQTQLTLQQVNQKEQLWFQKHLPTYNRESHCSINAVINAIDLMYSQHMREVWLPDMVQNITEHERKTSLLIEQLGIVPSHIDRKLMHTWFVNILQEHVKHLLSSYYTMPSNQQNETLLEIKKHIPIRDKLNIVPICDILDITRERKKVFNHIRDSVHSIGKIHMERFSSVLTQSFQTTNSGKKDFQYNISRFEQLHAQCHAQFKIAIKKCEKMYHVEFTNYLNCFESSRLGIPELHIEEIFGAELQISIRCFVIGLEVFLEKQGFFRTAFLHTDTLIENCFKLRDKYSLRMEAFRKAKHQLSLLRTI